MTKLVPLSSAVLERIEAERAHYERRAERIAALIKGQPDRSGVFDSERTWHREYADGARYGLDLAASIVRDAIAEATDLIVAASTVTVIDAEEFEAAHNDPEWRAFCEDADAYLGSLEETSG